MITKEQMALRARVDRDLLTLDQKIERQDAIIAEATDTRTDLYAARAGLLAVGVALRTGGEQQL